MEYVIPDGVHSGVQRTYEIQDGGEIFWAMEVLGSVNGMRVTAGASFGGTGATILSANTFIYNGEYLSELENVPSTGTGCPGGETSTTEWKAVEVYLVLPAGTTSVTVFVQGDHHPSCGAPGNEPFYIRNVAFEAVATNTPEGWTEVNADVFTIREGIGTDGTQGLRLEGQTGGT